MPRWEASGVGLRPSPSRYLRTATAEGPWAASATPSNSLFQSKAQHTFKAKLPYAYCLTKGTFPKFSKKYGPIRTGPYTISKGISSSYLLPVLILKANLRKVSRTLPSSWNFESLQLKKAWRSDFLSLDVVKIPSVFSHSILTTLVNRSIWPASNTTKGLSKSVHPSSIKWILQFFKSFLSCKGGWIIFHQGAS